MKIEVLFPEFCNLYGDNWNIEYLKKCSDNIEVEYTALTDEIKFVNGEIDLVYMGPMTEKTQEKVIKKLLPYKEKINELIEENKVFLFTGNAFEIFGKYIQNDDESKIEALGIFDFYSKREMLNRYAGMVIGNFNDIELIGYKNQFSQSFGNNSDKYFCETTKGIGLNPDSRLEGIHYKNFFGTYLLGPLFILNPLLVKYFLNLFNLDTKLAFEQEIMAANKRRIEEFERLNF